MRWGNPEYFWSFAGLAILAIFLIFSKRNQSKLLALWSKRPLTEVLQGSQSAFTKRILLFLTIVAAAFVILAWSRPQWGVLEETGSSQTREIIFLLDISRSMSATDVQPSRLDIAKHAIRKISDMIRGSRVGLVAFAGQAAVICPLTTDVDSLNIYLESLDTETFSSKGTALAEGVEIAKDAFNRGTQGGDVPKALVILSDGEDFEGSLDEAISLMEDVTVYTVGVGTTAGAPIPFRDDFGKVLDFRRDKKGQPVVTKLQPESLKKISEKTGGAYFEASSSLGEINELGTKLDGSETSDARNEKRQIQRWQERFQYFLFPGVLLLIAVFCSTIAIRWAGIFWILFLVIPIQTQAYFGPYYNNRAIESFEKDEKEKAAELLSKSRSSDPDLLESIFNQGVLSQSNGDIGTAKDKYDSVVLSAQKKTHPYNLALFNKAKIMEKAQKKDEAIDLYLEIIRNLSAGDKPQLVNDAKKSLEALQKQDSQQNQDKSNQDQKKQESKDKQDQQNNPKDQDEKAKSDKSEQDNKSSEKPETEQKEKKEEPKQLKTASEKQRLLESIKSEEKEVIKKFRNRLGRTDRKKQKDNERENAKDW